MSNATWPQKIGLPSIEKAFKDLEEYEKKIQQSNESVKQQQMEIEKLKCEKQYLLSYVEMYKQKVCSSQDRLMKIKTKIDDTSLNKQKAEVAGLYNKQKIKQIEDVIKNKTLHCRTPDFEKTSLVKYAAYKQDLLEQKKQLEETININNKKIENLVTFINTHI